MKNYPWKSTASRIRERSAASGASEVRSICSNRRAPSSPRSIRTGEGEHGFVTGVQAFVPSVDELADDADEFSDAGEPARSSRVNQQKLTKQDTSRLSLRLPVGHLEGGCSGSLGRSPLP